MNIQINIQAPELVQAIMALAASLGSKSANTEVAVTTVAPVQTYVQNPAVQETPTQNVVPLAPPVQQPVQTQPMAPPVQHQQPVAPVQQPVPTSAPTYTMDQLAVAATQLMDACRQPDLLSLLASFGVQSLMQLPQEQYGAFATKLRELGARI